MAAKRKTNTKKDLEEKIAELEAKLSKLSEQLDPPSATTSDEAPKPKEAPKPAERPAATTKPKGTLPKGMEQAQSSQQTQQTTNVDDGKSKSEKLADYEADYLKRLEQQKIDDAKAAAEAAAAEAAATASSWFKLVLW